MESSTIQNADYKNFSIYVDLLKIRKLTSVYALNEPVQKFTFRRNNFVLPPQTDRR
jgi:hypothetical protein